MKTSVEVPDDLMNKVKEYNNTHKSRPINMSGAFQECLENILKNTNQPQTKPKNAAHPEHPEESAEIIAVIESELEIMRQKWWDDKQIGLGIVKAGGIGIINLTNIIQKNPDLFETKEECRTWLYNKLKTEPPVIETETPKITNKLRKPTSLNVAEEPPKFTPNRSTVKCIGCGEEHLKLSGSTVRKCRNCGANVEKNTIKPQPDQHALAQDVPPSPPHEAKP